MRFLVILVLVPLIGFSQPGQHKYFIKFTDKNNSPYSITNPSAFLSTKALDRRNAHNIPVVENDLPVNDTYINGVLSLGAEFRAKSKWFNGIVVKCDSAVLMQIQSLPYVANSSLVFRKAEKKKKKFVSPSIPYSAPNPMRISGYEYGGSFNQTRLMHADYMHDLGFAGEGITIAVLDAGFASVDQLAAFDSLRARGGIIGTWDFVNNESSVYEDDTHGMAVLSTMAGNVPGQLIGTAIHASYYLLRTEDVFSENIIEEYFWAAGAEYADSAGADMISSSLGYTTFDDSTANHTYADLDGDHCPSSIAADIAASKGMLVITSAGNSGSSTWHYIGAPSDGDSVMSVAAVDSLGFHASFSSFGPAPDGRIKPNVAAKGLLSTVADVAGNITKANGTSFACPILAGAAACLWQMYPKEPAANIKKAIERSGNYYSAPNDSLGYGIPDFRSASYYLKSGTTDLQQNENLLEVYPNPFSSSFQVRFYSVIQQEVKIELINSLGQIMEHKTGNTTPEQVNLFTISPDHELQDGIYFVRLTSSSGSYVKAVVKS